MEKFPDHLFLLNRLPLNDFLCVSTIQPPIGAAKRLYSLNPEILLVFPSKQCHFSCENFHTPICCCSCALSPKFFFPRIIQDIESKCLRFSLWGTPFSQLFTRILFISLENKVIPFSLSIITDLFTFTVYHPHAMQSPVLSSTYDILVTPLTVVARVTEIAP